MLQACGVPEERIVPVGPWDAVQARHLFVPSHLSAILHPAWKASAWATKYLRALFLTPEEASARPTRRLYVSRRDATGRRVVNEGALVERLAEEGFEEVTLSGMGVAEQARLFASAKAVVAPHGAGLANLVFCRQGARVVEIFARTYGTPAFWLVADGRRLQYATYVVDRVAGGSRSQLDDVEVDVDDFEARALPFLTGEDG
jgi:capsular polysaccharide biosynthesis protein